MGISAKLKMWPSVRYYKDLPSLVRVLGHGFLVQSRQGRPGQYLIFGISRDQEDRWIMGSCCKI